MSADTAVTSAGPQRPVITAHRGSSTRARTVGFIALTAVAALATASLTVRSPQLGASAALVGLVVSAYVGHRPAGLVALWGLWLLAPGLRRVLGLETGYVGADPLAVAPFAATGLVAALALLQFRLSRQAKVVLAAGGVGLLLGLPAGVGNPAAAVFAAVAYVSALGALVIGWSEGHRPLRRWSLARALAVGAPVLGLYALYQYFVGLPAWDDLWLEQVDFVSVGGAPEEGKVRVFSTLNAPGVLAPVLALGLLLGLVRRRIGPVSLALMTLVTVALALTSVRSTWLALMVGLLVLLAITRGRATPQLLALVAVLGVAGLALSFSQGTLDAFVERASTFGDLGTDVSAQEREETARALAPRILAAPLGYGLGSAGEATRLAGDEGVRAVDNGYLSLAYQVGIPGALLVLVGLFVATWTSARSALRTDPDRTAATLTAVFAFFIVLLVSGDQLYGLPGAILWYLVGAALARQAAGGGEPAATPRRFPFARGGPSPPYSPLGDSQRRRGMPGSHYTSR
ncbi:MAG: O-antigen ligase family protein [Actinomycetota bacterium]|nr:O-antigen ligase family protein [Actinomycetota bacterium]